MEGPNPVIGFGRALEREILEVAYLGEHICVRLGISIFVPLEQGLRSQVILDSHQCIEISYNKPVVHYTESHIYINNHKT